MFGTIQQRQRVLRFEGQAVVYQISSILMPALRRTLPVFLLVVFWGSSLFAADDPPAKKLSLAEAVKIALSSNAEMKRAEVNEADSISRLRIASLATNFSVGSEAYVDRNPNESGLSSTIYGSLTYKSLSGTEASIDIAPFTSGSRYGSVGVRLSKPLMSGKGRLSAKADQFLSARNTSIIQSKELYLVRQAKVLEIVNLYYRAVLAREQVKVREEALAIVQESAEGARKREEAGLVKGIDVSRAESRVTQTRNELHLQRQAARTAMERLMVAIGSDMLKDSQSYELSDSVPDVAPELIGLAEAVKTALENRSELSISDLQLREQERKLAMREDRLKPELNAVASFNSTNDDPGIITGSIYDLGSLNLGFELRLPLDRRIDMEERTIAARDLDVLEKMRLLRMEEIAEEVHSAHRSVESARTTLTIYGENLDIAKDRLRIAQRMVEEGLADNREVLDAQADLTQLTNGILSAKIDLYLASVRLSHAMGEDLTTIIGQL